MKCHLCNFEVKETDEFCNNCGARIQTVNIENKEVIIEGNKCSNCGTKHSETDKFCMKCGNKLSNEVGSDARQKQLHCHICNNIVAKDDRFCNSCGAKLSGGFEVDPNKDIIAERFNYNKTQVKNRSALALWLSIAAVGIAFIIGGSIPYITAILSLIILGFAIYKLVKEKERINGWAIAVAILALMINGLNIVNAVIVEEYAFESSDRISEVVGVNLPDVEPSFYDISIIDGEVVKITLTMYDFNDIIYELDEDNARDFIALIENNNNFKVDHMDILEEEFTGIMLDGVDISLVYNIETKTFGLPMDLESYDLIIINYDYEESSIQVLEVSSKMVD